MFLHRGHGGNWPAFDVFKLDLSIGQCKEPTSGRLIRKRKAVRHREERFIASAPKQAWSINFVADQLQEEIRFRAVTMLDVLTRETVAIQVGQVRSIRSNAALQ
jgi:hypothetical protein